MCDHLLPIRNRQSKVEEQMPAPIMKKRKTSGDNSATKIAVTKADTPIVRKL
jgi:hypothetical protein